MAGPRTAQRNANREPTRRALIKWSIAAGAALGVSRSKIYEILDRTAGKATAFAASEHLTTRSVHLVGGNGGLAYMQCFWPQVDIAKANNPNFAWQFPGAAVEVAGTHRPLVRGADTPFEGVPAERQMTCFVCGTDETHTQNPLSTTMLDGTSIFAVAAALQSSSPSVIPLVTIGNALAGTASESATTASVSDADGIVGLFNSAASRLDGLLANTTDAELYKTQYDAFTQLNRAANRSPQRLAYATASGAAKLLGVNLADRLQVTQDDLTRYGITGTTRANVAALGRALIITTKAFKMGLMNALVLPMMTDDPHGLWDSGDEKIVPPQLKAVFDGFMADLITTIDDNTGVSLASDTVITICGDTTKDPLHRSGWPDGGTRGSNAIYMYGAGHAYSGWFGAIDRTGAVQGFGPDGKPASYNAAVTAKLATATIAYAIAKRDPRMIANFANGVTISGAFGPPKNV
jgi:hypothetical protein